MTGWPFGNLTPLRYGAIIADPPWAFRLYSDKGDKKSPQHHYDCMPLDAIRALTDVESFNLERLLRIQGASVTGRARLEAWRLHGLVAAMHIPELDRLLTKRQRRVLEAAGGPVIDAVAA